ncbi:MAG: phage head closure protein [Bacteroides sp.]
MRAGLLRDRIYFKELREIRSPTGFVKKEYYNIFSCKAYRKKLSTVLGNGIDAMEEFIGNTIVFQIRYYPIIKNNQRVEYQGNEYDISLLDRQIDNTYIITLTKINK